MMKLLAYAIDAVSRGMYVFPCRPGTKEPIVKWGAAATTDLDTVLGWWSRWPEANIGVAVKPSGFVVVDCDVPKANYKPPKEWEPYPDGFEQLTHLYEQAGKQWDFPSVVSSPRGGCHCYYTAPGTYTVPNSIGRIAPLIDIRAGGGDYGGYVLAPGSVSAAGTYAWESVETWPPRALPRWLGELCMPPPAEAPKMTTWDGRLAGDHGGLLHWLASVPPHEYGGGQNAALYRVACDLRKENVPYNQAMEELYAVSQQWQCSKGAWTWRDVETTVRSAYRGA